MRALAAPNRLSGPHLRELTSEAFPIESAKLASERTGSVRALVEADWARTVANGSSPETAALLAEEAARERQLAALAPPPPGRLGFRPAARRRRGATGPPADALTPPEKR